MSWDGFRPLRPPVALRERVLTAAWDAAAQADAGVFSALYRDRLLRACAAVLSGLVVANVVALHEGAERAAPAPTVGIEDGVAVPVDWGLTMAEQLDALAPVLGTTIARSRG